MAQTTSFVVPEYLDEPKRAYLSSLMEDERLSVFKNPAENWKDCKLSQKQDPETGKKYCINATGWLTRDAEVSVLTEPVNIEFIDPLTEELTSDDFVEVYFRYEVPQSKDFPDGIRQGRGYIQQKMLNSRYTAPFYSAKNGAQKYKNKIMKFCKDILNLDIDVLKSVEEIADKGDNQAVLKAAEAVYNHVGECPLTKTQIKNRKKNISLSSNVNAYDRFVLPMMKKSKAAKIKDPKITPEQLQNIDALARTIYGEMGNCIQYGLQYPIAVARVALNRSESSLTFALEKNRSSKIPKLTQEVTSPHQFNNWNYKQIVRNKKKKIIGTKSNGPLYQSLCPPKSEDKLSWTGKNPHTKAIETWKKAVLVATEAVLYPEKLKNRSSPDMDNVFFYTSHLGKYQGWKKAEIKIDDIDLYENNNSCFEGWLMPEPKTDGA